MLDKIKSVEILSLKISCYGGEKMDAKLFGQGIIKFVCGRFDYDETQSGLVTEALERPGRTA